MGASSQRSEGGAGVRSKIRVSILPFLEGEQEIFLNSRVSERIVKKGTVRTTWLSVTSFVQLKIRLQTLSIY
jgi:hypothetical protein